MSKSNLSNRDYARKHRERQVKAGNVNVQFWLPEDGHCALLDLMNLPDYAGKTKAAVVSLALKKLRDSLS